VAGFFSPGTNIYFMSEEIILLGNFVFWAAGGFVFLLGLMVGSFLNVCIWRLPREETNIRPGSHCPACSSPLGIRDLVPLLSWLFLRGKCRFCAAKISPRYPAVELLTGGLFLVTYLHYGPSLDMIAAMLFSAFMVAITFIDLDHQIILDGMLALLAASGLGLQLVTGAVGFWSMWLGALVGGGLLLILAIVSQGGMGGGDVKFAAALGFWLGWPGILLGLFIGFVAGGAVSLLLLVSGLRGRKDFIPFGPFIALGAWIALLYGKQILSWYLSFLI
jgi:leader peptidase (prepilin peptidase)/N-methyltransferase